MSRREIRYLETNRAMLAPPFDGNVPLASLPRAYFGAILADPPWRFETWSDAGRDRSADRHYPTMTMDEIRAVDVAALAARDSVLFLWAVWSMLPQAFALIEAWGFTYKTCGFCWTKADASQLDMFRDDVDVAIGTGYWTRANSEPCLLATRGKPRRIRADVRQAIVTPRREHSRKPDEIHDRIERLVAGPYLEMFARRRRPGWTVWGNNEIPRKQADRPSWTPPEPQAPRPSDENLEIPTFLRRNAP
jgi:N6-adenosine-specific RNA methylase IME4